ncbi:MAG: hypothetical protein OXC30_00320 [Alphaproteobacteria bacterium]|nr:hypothetical protein [Alphaproteobacteria bacterium]
MFILLLIFLHIFPLSSNAALAECSCYEEPNKLLQQHQSMFQESDGSFLLKAPYTVAQLRFAYDYFEDLCHSVSSVLLSIQADLRPNAQGYYNWKNASPTERWLLMEGMPTDPEDSAFHLNIPTLSKALSDIPSQIYSINPDPADLLDYINDLAIHQDLLLACKSLYQSDWELAYKNYYYWYFRVHPNRAKICNAVYVKYAK